MRKNQSLGWSWIADLIFAMAMLSTLIVGAIVLEHFAEKLIALAFR